MRRSLYDSAGGQDSLSRTSSSCEPCRSMETRFRWPPTGDDRRLGSGSIRSSWSRPGHERRNPSATGRPGPRVFSSPDSIRSQQRHFPECRPARTHRPMVQARRVPETEDLVQACLAARMGQFLVIGGHGMPNVTAPRAWRRVLPPVGTSTDPGAFGASLIVMSGIHCAALENPDLLLFQVSPRVLLAVIGFKSAFTTRHQGNASAPSLAPASMATATAGPPEGWSYARLEMSPKVTTSGSGTCQTMFRAPSALSRASFMMDQSLPRLSTGHAASVPDSPASGNRFSGTGGCSPTKQDSLCRIGVGADAPFGKEALRSNCHELLGASDDHERVDACSLFAVHP